jgi:hypothetical protein
MHFLVCSILSRSFTRQSRSGCRVGNVSKFTASSNFSSVACNEFQDLKETEGAEMTSVLYMLFSVLYKFMIIIVSVYVSCLCMTSLNMVWPIPLGAWVHLFPKRGPDPGMTRCPAQPCSLVLSQTASLSVKNFKSNDSELRLPWPFCETRHNAREKHS